MSAAESNIQFYSTLSTICLIVAIFAFLLALFFFFFFNIPTVFALKTGRAKRKTLERIQKQNSYTDKIRKDTNNLGTSASVQESLESPNVVAYQMHEVQSNRNVHTASLNDAADTSLLSSEAETSLLSNEAETSLLSNETETALLSEVNDRKHIVNGASASVTETKFVTKSAEMNPNWRFDLTEEIVTIHTNELI